MEESELTYSPAATRLLGVGCVCALSSCPPLPTTHIFRISLPLSPRIWKSPSRISGK